MSTEPKKTLDALSARQEAHIDRLYVRYVKELAAPPRFSMRPVLEWLDVVYGLYDAKRPERVEVVDSPFAALKLATELTGEKQAHLDWCGVADGGWVAFYECFETFGVLSKEEASDVLTLREFGRVAWDSVLLDGCAIVIRRPKRLCVDDDGNLHSTSGPAIEWRDGECDYAYHGTWLPERMVTAPRGYTKAEYVAITNTEERRALSEIAGWDWVIELLGGTIVDTWRDPKTRLSYELFACDDGQRLLRKQSPKLANGSQPFYIEPVHEQLMTARAARKWQATTLSAAECERDPELEYGVET
jgi:hypothetical protein